jgi:transaldolase
MIDNPQEGDYAQKILGEILRDFEDADQAIAEFQRRLVKPIAEKFLPIFKQSGGKQGYVSIQGDPIHEMTDVVIKEAMQTEKYRPISAVKFQPPIPAWQPWNTLSGRISPSMRQRYLASPRLYN